MLKKMNCNELEIVVGGSENESIIVNKEQDEIDYSGDYHRLFWHQLTLETWKKAQPSNVARVIFADLAIGSLVAAVGISAQSFVFCILKKAYDFINADS